MPLKTVSAQVGNTEIKVENTWFGGAKLLINGQVVAENKQIFSTSKTNPLMSVRTQIDGSERLIDVFAYAIVTVKIKICVDGKLVGGDSF